MKDELFEALVASLKEGGSILRGEGPPSHENELHWPDASAVRKKLDLTQAQFAALIGISLRTLQNWERGHRQPEGTARALFRVTELHSEAVPGALHR